MSESTAAAPRKQVSNAELQKRVEAQAEAIKDIGETTDANAETLEAANARIMELDNKLAQVLEALNGMAAAHRPISRSSSATFETEEYATQSGMVEPGLDDQAPLVERTRLMSVDSVEFKEKEEIEAFMAELVMVQIHTTSETNADQVFEIAVNNERCLFHRGERKVCKRKFVYGLATARPVHFDNELYTKSNGVNAYRYPSRSGLRYPFSVVRDDNPIGERWLKGVLAAKN